jgi:hypothetical protein
MGIYTFNSTLVKSEHVHAVTLYNCTLITSETGDYGPYAGYQIKVTHDTTGCGNPSSYFYLELKNDISWSRISCEFEVEGVASCWGFNDGSYALDGNLQSYNESSYDIIPNYRAINSWEKSQFQSHGRISACDNESNNFFHGSFHTGNPKRFLMRRRKNNLSNRGGLSHGRSCNNSGVYSIIRNIRIW